MEKILAIIMAVITDRWTERAVAGKFIARCRSVSWVDAYIARVMGLMSKLPALQKYLQVLLLLIPLFAGALAMKLIMMQLFSKMLGWLFFATMILFYLLGNKNLKEDYSEFVLAHEKNFAILFWFALFGPMAALLYWFFVVARHGKAVNEQNNPDLFSVLLRIHAVLAWVPARITGFIYALFGNFVSGFNCWLLALQNVSMPSSEVLDSCGRASVDISMADEANNLVSRAATAWAVLSVLIVIIKGNF